MAAGSPGVTLALLCLCLTFHVTAQNVRKKRQILPDQPRIITENGHLIFQSGTNHNITFRSSSGGGVYVDGLDLKYAVTQARANKAALDQMNTSSVPDNVSQRLRSLENSLMGQTVLRARLTTLDNNVRTYRNGQRSNSNRISSLATGASTLGDQVSALRSRVTALESTTSTTRTNRPNRRGNNRRRPGRRQGGMSFMVARMRLLTNRVTALEGTVRNLQTLLTTNECASNPCLNGGTCVDMFSGYFCRCPANWQGPRCTQDVNECSAYAGTDMGCQNGATCVNTPGSFRCMCATNWYGIHCSERHDDCTGASHSELCGHGTCVNEARVSPGMPKFRCICQEGWTTDGSNPACNVDVDECAGTASSRCSQDPPVQCVNIPGSFICGSCPAGYEGNGYVCSDVNECAINNDNGGCSLSPRVACINSRGSRTCGPCPSGYQGDGVTCTYVGQCSSNNGGCHPLATCLESGGFGVSCQCPNGYIGSGVGPQGCASQSQNSTGCNSNPCMNGGSCVSLASGSFRCLCTDGHNGRYCQNSVEACGSNPCQNGGTCRPIGHFRYQCSCATGYSGQNCEMQVEVCGGYRNSVNGTLSYPLATGAQAGHGLNCAWVITTTYNLVIRLQFTHFNLEQHSSCNFDFLEIHDGRDPSARVIGKYCGSGLPNGDGIINSTHNQIYLWFKTDRSVNSDGFSLNWTSHQPVCGGRLSGNSHGEISSPGYPGNYPHNRDCVWVVSVDPGSNIMFTFATLALESHANCSYDFLQIKDGENEDAPVLATFCNTVTPAPLYTTGPYAFVRFHSDQSRTDAGFHITYAAVTQGRSGCGGTQTGDQGEFTSPGYPSPYQHDAQCVWVIRAAPGNTIRLTFDTFDLETDSDCDFDSVTVRDGEDQNAPALGTFCGTDVPAQLTSSSNVMFVELETDESIAGDGFQARWTVSCGGTFSGAEGTIRSPDYPNAYRHSADCGYLITVAEGSRVLLTFTDFSLEEEDDCDFDYVEVYDGTNADASRIGDRLCGENRPSEIRATGNAMFLRFVTDSSISDRGFQATYSAFEGGCGEVINANAGVVSSPGHPSFYPHGLNCTWYITVDPGYIVRLSFHMFSLENGCSFDFVEVYDNSTMYIPSRLGRYCGSTFPRFLTSTENEMVIHMRTDGSVAREGFSASFAALNASALCGSELTSQTGVITSPNYPNNYPHDRECEWTITVPEGNQIFLNVTDFSLEYQRQCRYDYLEIRNGGFESSPVIWRECGTKQLEPILSQSNRLYIKLKTDHSQSFRGFRIEYDGGSSGCGGDLTTPTGSIISPNYPHEYPHYASCTWTVTVSRGSAITVAFMDFDVESHSRCNFDFLEIREDGPSGRVLGKLCGSTMHNPITSTSNRIWMQYRTDYSVSGRGFRLQYYTNCNNELTGNRGVIESPSFPNPYPHQANCTWTVRSTRGNKINVTFAAFNLESHTLCNFDRLQIRDGATPTSTVLGNYCGATIPAPFQSSGNALWFNFNSDLSIAYHGFRMEWVVDGCGGVLTGMQGTFTTPNYPQQYNNYQECHWTITVPTGYAIELTFTDFNLEFHSTCAYDGVEVFAGIDSQGPRLTQLCHTTITNQTMRSTGNNMFVKFRTDMSVTGTGFSANYRAIEGGCGGNFSVPSAVIQSANYPDNYPHNTECEWYITVAEGHVVNLTFTDFELEDGSCQFDYVNLYDGHTTNNTLLVSLCDISLPSPPSYISNNNRMLVRMRTDSSVSHKGFSAIYTTSCGGILNADVDGSIMSPNYPLQYPRGARCVWVITSQDNSRRVSLTVTHMEMMSYDNCDTGYVTITSGTEAPVNQTEGMQKYCGQTVPATITSEGSSMTVVFNAGPSSRGTGFRAVYSSSHASCGGEFIAPSGSFISPSYPNSYPMSVECVWQIRTSPGNSVSLSFPFFSLEPNGGYNGDYVEIRSPNASGTLLGRWTGSDGPDNVTSVHGAWIIFRSDEQTPGQGFTATWTLTSGGSFTEDTGQLSSPGYPGRYSPSLNIEWSVIVTQGMVVRIDFSAFALERGGSCSYDYVQIFDGDASTGVSLGKFCGQTVPPTVMSNTNAITVIFVTDSSFELTGFLLSWQAVNPGDLTTSAPGGSSGSGCDYEYVATEEYQNFTTPNYPDNYENGMRCSYRIRSPEGTTILINITDMILEGSPYSCSYDYLRFYDGELDRSSVLGTICGRSHNGETFQSSGNEMGVKFRTDSSVVRRGAMVSFKIGCGGRFTRNTPRGIIKSPGYPQNYPADQECTWRVNVRPGKTIAVNFATPFNIADTDNCNNDYLLLLNGRSLTSPPLYNNSANYTGRLCGSVRPSNIETDANNLFVKFVADQSGSGAGFSLNFTERSVACGGTLSLTRTMSEGFFTSPNYPEVYPHNVDCLWVILSPANTRIRLDFVGNFSIENHPDCRFDYVEFHDGGTPYSPRLGDRQCGTDMPGSTHSTGNVLLTRFRTDDSIPRQGFRIRYSIDTCGGNLVASSGQLTSPNFPSHYGNNLDCEWTIRGPVGHFLQFNFTQFSVERAVNCSKDVVEIRDGNATSNVLFSNCGIRQTYPPVETSDNTAYIRFHTDDSGIRNGFRLLFQASVEECGGNLNSPSGVLTSPNFPNPYAHRRLCRWRITVPEGRRVTLTFTDFELERISGRFCRWDFVMVLNGITRTAPSMGRYCGDTIPDPIRSSGNTMEVVFRTDASVSHTGFRAVYSSDEEAECGGYIDTAPGNFSSPGFPSANYTHSLNCVWRIHNPNIRNSSLLLRLAALNLEFHAACAYDYLEIREGPLVNSPVIKRFCGNSSGDESIVIPGADAYVLFRTDGSIALRGFWLMHQFTQCGGVLTSQTGVITSPNYPNNYDHNDACSWLISLPEGSRVRINFDDFQFENHTDCQYDYLQIQNGGLPDSPQIGQFCGNSLPPEIFSQGNQVRITMRTDFSLSARGFRLRYAADTGGCGGMYHSNEGYIASPNYPSSYPHNTECRWDLNVALGFVVRLRFNAPFDLEASGCFYDYVEVHDVLPNGTLVPIGRWCRNEVPPELTSSSTRMVVIFRTDHNTNGLGFSANWTTACGGLYTSETGTIYSPNYPGNYPNNIQCNYTISPGENKHVTILFDDFALESGSQCRYDNLSIWQGNSSLSYHVGSFCGTSKPTAFTSPTGLYMRFATDGNSVARGFKARYMSDECGGNLTGPSGQFSTPGHGIASYHRSADCTWHITVSENRIAALKFTHFDLERHSRCGFDSVEVFDGPNATSPSLGRFCGDASTLPESIRATGNHMFVRFRTDWSVQKDGFRATYYETFGPAQGCGGVLRQPSGQIRSLDADGDGRYESNLNCEWLIYVGENKVVNFTITGMGISDYTPCAWDSLKIYDGATKDSPGLGIFCGSTVPSPLTSSGNVILVVFKSDFSYSGAGFNASFSESNRLCGGFLNATSEPQTIQSPNYPNPMGTQLRCTWVLDGGSEHVYDFVKVTVTDLQLAAESSCRDEYLMITDTPMDSQAHTYHYCGTTIPRPFISRKNQASVIYSLPAGSSSSGFSLTYETTSCNQNYSTGDNGRITSPWYPGSYRFSSDCRSTVETPEGTTLTLYFAKFYLERHSRCRYDSLTIYNNTNFEVAKLCGNYLPDPIFLSDNKATLRLRTDSSVQYLGYDITYVASTQGIGCGGNVTGLPAGSITSPLYPGNFTSDTPTSCSWLISPPPRSLMMLRIDFAPQPSTTNCVQSYLEIRQGPATSSPLMGRFCNEAVSNRMFNEPILVRLVVHPDEPAPIFRLFFYDTSYPVTY